MSTFHFYFAIIMLIIIFIISIWLLVVETVHNNSIKNKSYTRGSNAWQPGEVKMKCESDKKICVERAIQICTNPDENNFETDATDPIDSGYINPENYGNFNPDTTVNLLKEVSKKCDGNQECKYIFTGETPTKFGVICEGTSQLISTYTCVPKDKDCIK